MRGRIAALMLVTVACGNIGSPQVLSSDTYEYRNLNFGDPIVFNWPRSTLPVRVWVAGDSPLQPSVTTAITRWQNAFLYGEFRAIVVADSNTADVIVQNAPSDIGGGLDARASQCSGETDQAVDPIARTLVLPVHIFVFAIGNQTPAVLATCYNITMTHEFGHVLGIINALHSGTTVNDVMFANPSLDGLSDHDRLTAVILYSIPSTLTITGRR